MRITYLIFSSICAALSLPIINTLRQYSDDNTNRTEKKLEEALYHVYTSENEILNLVLPLESLTYRDGNVKNATKSVLFIIESNGAKENIISVYNGGNVTKLIEGNDVTVAFTGENIYIATNNGIYSYKDNKTEKYGSLSDKFTSIALLNNTSLYALSGDRKLYKITNNGTKKEIVNEVNDAERIVADADDIYYQNSNNDVFVYNNKGVRKVEGMPNDITNMMLLKAYVADQGALPILINKDKICIINYTANCTLENMIDIGFKINSLVMNENTWFVVIGNAVYEYDLMRKLYSVLAVYPSGYWTL